MILKYLYIDENIRFKVSWAQKVFKNFCMYVLCCRCVDGPDVEVVFEREGKRLNSLTDLNKHFNKSCKLVLPREAPNSNK